MTEPKIANIASLIGALGQCIGKLEAMGVDVGYPEKVFNRYV